MCCADDECPNEPETVNEHEDEDGCPDTPPIVVVQCSEIELGETVYFDLDSDVIQARSHSLLDNLVTVLQEHPEILKMRIEGHTDSWGTRPHNLDLSDRRANSVMRYLVEHGVDAGRLEAQGFGEARPIADNATEEGRSTNRRVEIHILEQEGCD